METQYRTESYACTRTETVTRTIEKVVKAETNVSIITNGLVEEFPVSISITENDNQYSAFSMNVKLEKEPKVFVVLKKKTVTVDSVNDKEIILKGNVVLEVLTKEMLPVAFPASIVSATIEQATKKLVIVFDGAISPEGSVDLVITYKAFLSRLQKIAELKADYPGAKVVLGAVDGKAALSVDLKDAMVGELQRRNMKLKLNLGSKLNLQGELMNATKPELSKAFDGPFVSVK